MHEATLLSCGVVATFLAVGCGQEGRREAAPVAAAPLAAVAQGKVAGCAAGFRCFRDTARVREIDTDPGAIVDADWIFFGAAMDSLEIDAGVGESVRHDAFVTAFAGGPALQERNPAGNTAAWVRFRPHRAGAVRVNVSLDEFHGDTIPYVLRLKQSDSTSSWAAASGARAVLAVSAPIAARIAVIPVSAPSAQDDLERWAVPPRTYRVALANDSQYVVCLLPCTRRDTITLLPGALVTRQY